MEIAQRVDHTLLDKDAPASAYERLSEEAKRYGTNVCVPPSRLGSVAEVEREIAAVVGFPHGTTTSESKAHEARLAVEAGATEIDMACNVSLLKSDQRDAYVRDVRAVADAVSVPVKAIIETGLLSDDEKRLSARLCVEAGAEYVKTCTGYAPGEATVEDVSLLKDAVGEDARVKASGGIRDAESAIRLLEAGASRIGASAGEEIVRGARSL
jgi:deoxyribose-phosphate aldolase